MTRELVKCWDCQRDFFPNQLREVPELVIIKKKVCKSCVGTPQTLKDIEANKRNAAKATAWNNGQGWA